MSSPCFITAAPPTVWPRSTFLTRGSGFTLIEVLVVVGLIVLLASLLVPVMSRARESAIASRCNANQKSLILGLLAYAQDNNGTLPVSTPGTNRWFFRIAPYVAGFGGGSVVNPPGARMTPAYAKIAICPIPEHAGYDNVPGTYGLLEGLGSKPDGLPQDYPAFRLARISRMATLPVMCCQFGPTGGGHVMTTDGPNRWATNYGYVGTNRISGPGPNHRGKCNFAFLDGHVELRDVTKRDQWPWNEPDAFKIE
jgi:prepilin-type processing-associated H-X9-DG protein/prepilin-type N-terminal cleavage/methylation domain-containing protein